MKLKFLMPICFLLLCGCWGGLAKQPVIKHPDSSVQIIEVNGDAVKVAVYSKTKNKMIVYGWIDLEKLKGWTITKYDWEKKIKERSK